MADPLIPVLYLTHCSNCETMDCLKLVGLRVQEKLFFHYLPTYWKEQKWIGLRAGETEVEVISDEKEQDHSIDELLSIVEKMVIIENPRYIKHSFYRYMHL